MQKSHWEAAKKNNASNDDGEILKNTYRRTVFSWISWQPKLSNNWCGFFFFPCRMLTFIKNDSRGRTKIKTGEGCSQGDTLTICPLPNRTPPLTLWLEALKHTNLWWSWKTVFCNQIFIQWKLVWHCCDPLTASPPKKSSRSTHSTHYPHSRSPSLPKLTLLVLIFRW